MTKPNINNLVYKVVSVFLAILLWLYVSHQENPVTDQIFTVPLEVRGLAQNLVVSNKPSFVKVRIQGQRKFLETITPSDVHAFVELDGLDVGNHIVEVHVTLPKKTQLISAIPSNLNISIEVTDTVQLPIKVSYSDSLPAKGFMALKPVLSPAQVLITGPEDKLKNIEQVYVEVNLGDIEKNFHQKMPVKIEDKNGNLVQDWLNVTPVQVDVLVPIVREIPSKTIAVKIPLTGTPSSGYKVGRIVADPELVTVYGEIGKLNKTDVLTTTPIDINKATRDVVRKVNVIVPKGLFIAPERPITVVVNIEKIVQKSFDELPVKLKNSPSELIDATESRTVRVVIEGPKSEIEKLQALDLEPYVDLAGLDPGEHQVPVLVNIPGTVWLVRVEPGTININIP